LARHPVVDAAWSGLDPADVWDMHAHLLGIGDAGSGAWAHPSGDSPLHPVHYLQRRAFLDAACADGSASVDRRYVDRLVHVVSELPRGARAVVLAFDRCHAQSGEPVPERTALHVPNEYAATVSRAHADRIEWGASVHPYRPDAIDALGWCARNGASLVKWIPSAQGIDPASPRCDRFYAALAQLDLPLLSHAGRERAIEGANEPALGNPLRLRRAIDAGVRVIVAHCATMGESHDLDAGPNGPMRPAFHLFARLMEDASRRDRTFGDLSAVTQAARAWALPHLIERTEWHDRLLNGSDYPLPGLMPLYSTGALAGAGLLDIDAVPVLTEIRRYNPVLYDFVLKRSLRWRGRRFGDVVFQTGRRLARRGRQADQPDRAP
jgi:mannonate dehydratase